MAAQDPVLPARDPVLAARDPVLAAQDPISAWLRPVGGTEPLGSLNISSRTFKRLVCDNKPDHS